MTASKPFALALRGALALSGLLACSKTTPDVRPEPSPKTAPSAVASVSASAVVPDGPLVLAHGMRMAHAAPGPDAAKVVKEALDKAKSDGRDVVVYVGAKWCEPCQRFHKAAAAGDLDDEFPNLTLLEFDLDDDRDRLVAAGYRSDLIPLFVKPAPDGRASEKRFEGSVKGDMAVANIAPRLRALLKN